MITEAQGKLIFNETNTRQISPHKSNIMLAFGSIKRLNLQRIEAKSATIFHRVAGSLEPSSMLKFLPCELRKFIEVCVFIVVNA